MVMTGLDFVLVDGPPVDFFLCTMTYASFSVVLVIALSDVLLTYRMLNAAQSSLSCALRSLKSWVISIDQ